MPKAERARVITGREMIIAEDVCLAMVGLVGKGSAKGVSGAWPLLPLAPYADAVLVEKPAPPAANPKSLRRF